MAKRSNSIELRHLRYFVSAAEQSSFGKAAGTLGMQKSAISRGIRDLEDQLGDSLFQRHSGGICLTLAGQRFLRCVRTALRQIEDGAKDVAAIGRSEEEGIKVGIFSSLASGFLFELLRTFDQDHSSILVELVDGKA